LALYKEFGSARFRSNKEQGRPYQSNHLNIALVELALEASESAQLSGADLMRFQVSEGP
jgi:hypothetical protein